MPLPGFLTSVFGGGKAVEVASTITNGLDKLFTSKEEKLEAQLNIEKEINRHFEKMEEMANTELELYLKDVQDARNSNVKIQESDKASWLAKNIGYCLDIFVTFIWGFLTVYLLSVMLSLVKKDATVDYTAVTAVWGGVGAYMSTILNFHRGTSKSSEDKQKVLIKQMEVNK